METAIQIGSYGERVAALFIRRQGYRVLTRNFKAERDEIDLVCRHGGMLVFVEVRSRSSELFGRPVDSIDARKEEALRRASLAYLRLLERDDIYYRFDAVEVRLKTGEKPDCTLIPNIFAKEGNSLERS